VAWALARLAEVTGDQVFGRAATRNLSWVVSQEESPGLYGYAGASFLHFTAYVGQGLAEGGKLARLPAAFAAAERMARCSVKAARRADGGLYGEYDDRWQPKTEGDWRCLVGELQMSLLWLSLATAKENDPFRRAATQVVAAVARAQAGPEADPDERGALAGSLPFDGPYLPGVYPSWAAKFFVDALNRLTVPNHLLRG